jgi:hypothetical protein
MSSNQQKKSAPGYRSGIQSGSSLRQTSNSSKLTFNGNNNNNNNNNSNDASHTDTRSTLLNKEEEYKRLNAELEKKTANLVYEAEQVLKANEKLIHETDYLNKISDVDFLNTDDRKAEISSSNYYKASYSGFKKSANYQTINNNLINNNELGAFKQKISNYENYSDNEDINVYDGEINDDDNDENEDSEQQNEEEKIRKKTANGISAKGSGTNSNIKKLVNKIIDTTDGDTLNDGLIPQSANDMSSVAQIRFLKAKLKVMQEEIDRCNNDLGKKDEENVKLAQRCKDLDEDRAKQLRISNSHQTQMEKYKKHCDDLQLKLNANEIQMNALKKENDQFKKDSKKGQIEQQQLELRLNRALEEIEKSKLQLQKTSSNSKDLNDQEKRRIEQLQSDNKRLQKQKTELIQAFKKQLKLIDILKKQKMHLEATKILQFSEEEFMNALEWNSANAGYSNNVTTGGEPSDSSRKTKPNNQAAAPPRPPSGSSNRLKQNNQTNLNNKTTKQQETTKPLMRTMSLGNIKEKKINNLHNLQEYKEENNSNESLNDDEQNPNNNFNFIQNNNQEGDEDDDDYYEEKRNIDFSEINNDFNENGYNENNIAYGGNDSYQNN